MISSFWNNIANGTQILVGSGESAAHLQRIDLNSVYNRGELVGLLLETVTKVANPGAGHTLSVFYAFSDSPNRIPEQFPTPGQLDCAVANAGVGTVRSYGQPIVYQGGRYLYIWFTASTFGDTSAKLELDLRVLAKTMN